MSISVIIPVFNGERYIAESIQTALNQKNCLVAEILVVDDGSTDGTAEVASSFGEQINYQYQENLGVGAARNHGASMAKGEYLAFLDADDLWDPHKLERQVEELNRKEVDMVFSHVQHFKCPLHGSSFTHEENPIPGIFALTLLIRTSSFQRTEGFPEGLQVGEFIDWYSQAQVTGLSSYTLPDVLAHRRIHQSNMTIQKRDSFQNYASVLKQHLDRKRKACVS